MAVRPNESDPAERAILHVESRYNTLIALDLEQLEAILTEQMNDPLNISRSPSLLVELTHIKSELALSRKFAFPESSQKM